MMNKMSKVVVIGAALGMVSFGAHAGQVELGAFGQNQDLGTNDVTEFGVDASFHNIYDRETGAVYESNVNWGTGDESGVDSTTLDFSTVGGYRMTVSPDSSLDLIGGFGYSNWELDSSIDTITAKAKAFYLQLGGAFNYYLSDANTLRFELGTKYNVAGDLDYDISGVSESYDIENQANMYAEASWMTEETGFPLKGSVFYEARDLEFDTLAGTQELDRDVMGVKVSVLF